MAETLDHHPVKQVAGDSTGVPPLPHHNRRPKAREVSSRFMSPVVSAMDSTSSSPKHSHSVPASPSPSPVSSSAESQSRSHIINHHRSKTVQHPNRRSQEQDSMFSDETSRSWDTPLRSHNRSLSSSSSSTTLSVVRSLQMKPRVAVKLYKENGEGSRIETTQLKQQNSDVMAKTLGRNGKNVTATPIPSSLSSRQRPDTPQIGTERVVPSRFRLSAQNFQRRAAATTAAAKLLQSSGLSMSAGSQDETMSIASDDDKSVASTNDNNGDPVEFSSSVDSSQFTKVSSSACSRSLNFTPSSFSEHNALKPSESLVLRPSSTKLGNISLPPHPNCMKPGVADAAKKGRKMVSTHQDDVHSLKLLHNRYLQLRFANAKAEFSMSAQRRESERKIYSLGVKTSELREVMTRKRAELGILQRAKTLSTILEAHMPYLDEWSAVEEDYSNSLSGVIQSLVNSALRLPVSGDVQADAREITDALNSATSMMQMIGVHVNRFLPKANEMDSLISELSGVVHGEKALVEECGDLLFKDYASQVEDCSLRGHIMQLKRINCIQPIQEE